MKLKMLAALLTGSLIGMTLLPAGFAQEDNSGFDNPGRQGRGMMPGGPRGGMQALAGRRGAAPGRMLANLDSDGDGRISEDEFVDERARQIEQLFNRRDTDGNGELSAEETERPARPQRDNAPRRPPLDRAELLACAGLDEDSAGPGAGGNRGDRFADADSNGDGTLTLAEVTNAAATAAQARFADLDDDGDGYITTAELRARAEANRERQQELRACIRDTLRGDN